MKSIEYYFDSKSQIKQQMSDISRIHKWLTFDCPESWLGVPPSCLKGSKCRKGRRIVEVFRIQLKNDTEKTLAVYGIIYIGFGCMSRVLYCRSQEECEYIKPGKCHSLLLTGPSSIFVPADFFVISAYLMDKNSGKVVSNGCYTHTVMQTGTIRDLPCNRPRSQMLHEKFEDLKGFAKVNVDYVVYRYAIGAEVEVSLIDDCEPCTLYGKITSPSTKYPALKSVLLSSDKADSKTFNPGDVIPLSRSVVAVPSNSALTVVARLWDANKGEIACGQIEFPAKDSGTSEGVVGKIRVRVTWRISCGTRVEGLQKLLNENVEFQKLFNEMPECGSWIEGPQKLLNERPDCEPSDVA